MDYPKEFRDDQKFTLGIEGGFSDRKNDLGGRTNFGIIQRNYDNYRDGKKLPRRDVKLIEHDEVDEIYYGIWRNAYCHELKSMALRLTMFDTATNWNELKARKFLQQALGVTADGVIGPGTKAALAKADQKHLAEKILDIRFDYRSKRCIENNTQLEFLKGWIRRDVKLDRLIHRCES